MYFLILLKGANISENVNNPMEACVIPVEIFSEIAKLSWAAYRGFVSCNKALHKAIYRRDWKYKYSYICVFDSCIVNINVQELLEKVGTTFYRVVASFPNKTYILYHRRLIIISHRLIGQSRDSYIEPIQSISRRLLINNNEFIQEEIDYNDGTITRSRHVLGTDKYLPLMRQTSRYKVVYENANRATSRRVLCGDVEWSLEHEFFIF